MLSVRCLFALFLIAPLCAQGTALEYRRADENLGAWRRHMRQGAFNPDINWRADGGLWYRERGGDRRFVLVNADGSVRRAKKAKHLGLEEGPKRISPKKSWGRSSSSGRAASVTFENKLQRKIRLFWVDGNGRPTSYGELAPGERKSQSTFVGHVWIADYQKDDLVGIFVVEPGNNLAVFDRKSRRAATAGEDESSARANPLRIREHDVWLQPRSGKAVRLTSDGTAADPYRQPRHVSPDGKSAFGFRVERGEEHLVHFVESSPRDQVQPKLHTRNYTKPGDRIDRPRPKLFDIAGKRAIRVDEKPFEDAWSINRVHWAKDSSEVYCLYNRRGHQVLRVYAINAKTGKVRTVLEEKSDTFVDYSQKTCLHWLDDDGSFLWMSERDGFNHLYMVNAKTGRLRQITKGVWLVRSVERVDHKTRQIWFRAYGIHEDQDPYHAHLARIDFDGKNLTKLTESDGSHRWEFSPDRSMFVARWSRADHPWVTELRRSSDGKLIAELGRDDIDALLASGYRPPERFVAKGRDGKTDIHGILLLPSHFDPTKRYPVIEDIYAGPHSHFVPKRWGVGARQRKLTELGFVVVQIDGMGTNWRSRAFHDVCWRNLKDSGFIDRKLWMTAAAKTRPWMDLTKVGIFGGSAGGQSSLAALLHHGDFYHAAVSDCGCHDNRMDKIWWNEAWMGWPIGPWYADSSNVTHAAKLRGKLMLTVGENDRNVDPASTMQVVHALIRADKDFDLVVVPGADHGVGEISYLVRRRQDFFVRHLMGVEPRR